MNKRILLPKKKLDTADINPKLLRIGHFTSGAYMKEGEWLEKRHVCDYEIEFFTFSKGGMIIDDEYLDVHPGDIIVKKPGQYTRACMPYKCYFMGIDLTRNDDLVCHANNQYVYDYQNTIIDTIPTRTVAKNPGVYRSLFDEILQAHLMEHELGELVVKQNIISVLRKLYAQNKINLDKIDSPYTKMFKDIKELIEERLAQHIDLKLLSNHAGMSPAHFHKIFKHYFGITPNQYIINLRIEKAKRLLIGEGSVLDIAIECGFETATYFATVFKKNIGMTPTAFRKIYGYYT